MLLQIWQTPPPMRLIILASLVAIVSLGALARDHGEKRGTGSITALVVHTVGGPACIASTVQFRPIAKRDDDAQFWQKILKTARNEAHYVIGRNGTAAQVMPPTDIAYHTAGINDVSIGMELVHRRRRNRAVRRTSDSQADRADQRDQAAISEDFNK
jgi:hypothetical protein